jgi:hypothetical protein
MICTTSQVGDTASDRGRSGSISRPVEQMNADELRQELGTLRERQRQIAELLNCRSPEKLLHDLRNLLNEVQLLRILAEQATS